MKYKKNPKLIIIISVILLMICGATIYASASGIGPFDKSPEIKLNGQSSVTIYLGDSYKDPGAKAFDYGGNDISAGIKIQEPDSYNAGSHKIAYTICDNSQKVSVTRQVRVAYKRPDKSDPTYGQGISVLMYHNVYDENNPPKSINANYIKSSLLEEELQYLVDEQYYFPTWNELRQYVDGKIDLPRKSVFLTFDDCTDQFIKNGLPLIEKYNIKATSFVITSHNGTKMASKNLSHLDLESHSNDMHRPGGNIGHGGVFTAFSHDEALKDLNTSIKILGNGDAFAYPFGDYNDDCVEVVKDAGFKIAFTTEYGQVCPGDNPLLLPRVRVCGDISLDVFKAII